MTLSDIEEVIDSRVLQVLKNLTVIFAIMGDVAPFWPIV